MEISISSLYWKTEERTQLFHFQGDCYFNSNLTTESSTHIYISKDTKELTNKEFLNSDYLLSIIISEDKGYFVQRIPHLITKDLWLVLNFSYTNQVKGHRLREGDVIRLGKVQFKILEAKISYEQNTPLISSTNNCFRYPLKKGSVFAMGEQSDLDPPLTQPDEIRKKKHSTLDYFSIESTNRQSIGSVNNETYLQFTCRICFGDSSQDLLINICNCTGSVKYIHIKCLWKWIISKITFKTHQYLSLYSYKPIQCELCHYEIPEVIMVNNNLLYLYQPYNILSAFSDEKKDKYENFLALEHIKSNKSNEDDKEKTVYIINFFDRNKLTLGRGQQSDVHLVDYSINDIHAELSIDNNSIYINDLDSIYGTHLLIENNARIPISIKQPLGFQLGKVFISIQAKKTFLWCCWLFKKKKALQNYYKKRNCLNHITSNNIVEEYLDREEEKAKQARINMQVLSLRNVDVYEKELNSCRAFFNEIEEEHEDIHHYNNNNNNNLNINKEILSLNKSSKKVTQSINLNNHKNDDRSHIIIHSTLEDLNFEEGVIGSTRVLMGKKNNNNKLNKKDTKDKKKIQPEQNMAQGSFNRTLVLKNTYRPYYFS